MIQKTVEVVSRYSNHPVLVGLFVLGVLFLLSAVILTVGLGRQLGGGFMLVFAIIWFAMGVVGYAILFTVKFIREIQRRRAPG